MARIAVCFTIALAAFCSTTMAEIIADSPPSLVSQFELGSPVAPPANPERATYPLYDNVTAFTGFGVNSGGAAAIAGILTTRYIADDIIMNPVNYGASITGMTWCVANFNAEATTARMRVRWHQDSVAGPGTYINGFSFAALALPVGISCWTYDQVASIMTVPATTRFWAGITFDNSGAAATTAAQLNNLGMGIFDPPTEGSSANLDFLTTAASIGNVSSPPGLIRNAPYTVNANHGWQLRPEPGTISLIAIGALSLLRRRR